jgi:hypothetical protein
MRSRSRSLAPTALVAAILLSACAGAASPATGSTGSQMPTGTTGSSGHVGSPSPTEAPIPSESPVPTENSPPGDIPDNIAFVPYASKRGGFTISTPEGWSRTTTPNSVTFTDKLNTIVVGWQDTASAPTVSSVKTHEVPELETTERAFALGSVASTTLPAGPAVLTTYQANSEPNAVTGKQYRLDVQRYSLYQHGTEVVIGLRSPVGADNVDPWRVVTQSFMWR